MKRGTKIFMMLSLFIIVIPIIGFFIFMLPMVITELSEVIPVPAYLLYPCLIALYAAIILFLFALYQTLKLLSYIYKNKVFSELHLKVLKNIKFCSSSISVLYVIGMPLLYVMGDKDDAPGIILFGLIVIVVTGVSAVYTAVFEKRCQRYEII